MIAMNNSTNNDKKFFRRPHIIDKKFGSLNVEMTLKTVKDLPNTTNAMSKIAKEERKDDINNAKGENDYTSSLLALFNAFDTFIREYSNEKSTAGQKRNYNFSCENELTIFLLWQIRHIWTHKGCIIDMKCKQEYEKVLKMSLIDDVRPIINLPHELKINYEFTIDFENYGRMKEAIFQYIGKKVSEEDLRILRYRSAGVLKWTDGFAYLKTEQGVIEINIEEAISCGCEYDFEKSQLQFPSGKATGKNQTLFLENGQSLKVRFLNPQNPKDSVLIKTVLTSLKKFQENNEPPITFSFIEHHKDYLRETILVPKKFVSKKGN